MDQTLVVSRKENMMLPRNNIPESAATYIPYTHEGDCYDTENISTVGYPQEMKP